LVLGEGGVEGVQVVGEASDLALEEEQGCLALLFLLVALPDMLVRLKEGGRRWADAGNFGQLVSFCV
jgi:hypothetical protein